MMAQAPFLPNEIWLAITEHCDLRDAWLSLRQVNKQLHDCVDQHFAEDILPRTVISLPIALPTYDVRNPQIGKALLDHHSRLVGTGKRGSIDRAVYSLLRVEPAQYRAQLLSRWNSMQYYEDDQLNEKLRWDMRLGHANIRVQLKDARISTREDVDRERACLAVDWKPTLTYFFRRIHPGQIDWSW